VKPNTGIATYVSHMSSDCEINTRGRLCHARQHAATEHCSDTEHGERAYRQSQQVTISRLSLIGRRFFSNEVADPETAADSAYGTRANAYPATGNYGDGRSTRIGSLSAHQPRAVS
jgi:hypothetical protein